MTSPVPPEPGTEAMDALAEAVTPKATDLRRAVADRDPDAVAAILTELAAGELYALAVVLADDAGAPKVCRNCGKTRQRRADGEGFEGARDYCGACYVRARDAGFPEVVPPAMSPAEVAARASSAASAQRMAAADVARAARLAEAARAARLAGQVEDYGFLRDNGSTPADARARTGVSRDTAAECEKARREAAGQVVAA